MIDTIVVFLLVVSAVWVYLDATKNRIGKIKGEKGMFNMSAGAWAVVTMFLWVVGFPAYLMKRGELIEKARRNPVTVTGRTGKALVLGVVGGLWVVLTMVNSVLAELPACDDKVTKNLVGKIIDDMPLVKAAGARFVDLKEIVEQGYNESSEIRSCGAILVTTIGEDNLQYHIKWSSKDAGEFFVEVQVR